MPTVALIFFGVLGAGIGFVVVVGLINAHLRTTPGYRYDTKPPWPAPRPKD